MEADQMVKMDTKKLEEDSNVPGSNGVPTWGAIDAFSRVSILMGRGSCLTSLSGSCMSISILRSEAVRLLEIGVVGESNCTPFPLTAAPCWSVETPFGCASTPLSPLVSASFIIRVTVTVTSVTLREEVRGILGKTGTKAGVQLLSNLSFAEFEFTVSNPATCFNTPLCPSPHPRPPQCLQYINILSIKSLVVLVLLLLHFLEHRLGLILSPCCGKKKPRQQIWNKQAQTRSRCTRKKKIVTISPPVHCGSSSASLAYLSNASRG